MALSALRRAAHPLYVTDRSAYAAVEIGRRWDDSGGRQMTFAPGPGGFGAPTDPEVLREQAAEKVRKYSSQAGEDDEARAYRKTHPGWLWRLFRRR